MSKVAGQQIYNACNKLFNPPKPFFDPYDSPKPATGMFDDLIPKK